MRRENTFRTGVNTTVSNEYTIKVEAACQPQLRTLPAARRTRNRWSVGKVITENGGHGCRRLTGRDCKDDSLVAIGTRAENEVRSSP